MLDPNPDVYEAEKLRARIAELERLYAARGQRIEELAALCEKAEAENARLRAAWDALERKHWTIQWSDELAWEVGDESSGIWNTLVDGFPTPLEAVLAAIDSEKGTPCKST